MHARFSDQDYASIARAGLKWARDGLIWRVVEESPGSRDWGRWTPLLRSAQDAGVEVVWDILHFGLPDWVDPWSDNFPCQAARFARAVARHHREVTGTRGLFCPINEMSFWAFAGGEAGWLTPLAKGRGREWKLQIVKAAIAMARAIRVADPAAGLVWAEPLVWMHATDGVGDAMGAEVSARYVEAQFEAMQWLLGDAMPELGGSPALADALGFNFYPHNQRFADGRMIGFGAPHFRGLSDLLGECHRRFPGHPFLVMETGAEGPARGPWVHFIAAELEAARAGGVPVGGACLYPVTDYPGWDDDRLCPTGLLGMPDLAGRRRVDSETARALHLAETRLEVDIRRDDPRWNSAARLGLTTTGNRSARRG